MNAPTIRHAIANYMTPAPHSVGREQPLNVARDMMRSYGIRHLPVLERGKLAGILSQRDIYFVESLGGPDASDTVGEAMSQDTYSVPPDTPVEEVAQDMADHKYGCAVIMEGHKVVGVFTTTDALQALTRLLSRTAGAS